MRFIAHREELREAIICNKFLQLHNGVENIAFNELRLTFSYRNWNTSLEENPSSISNNIA